MALTAEQEASRQFAFSGNATLADIPGLLRRLTPPPSNSPNINLSFGGGEDPARARGGGSNITNQFGVIPAVGTISGGTGGVGALGPAGNFLGGGGGGVPGFGGRGGADTDSTGSATTDSFGDFSSAVETALSGPFGILGMIASEISKANESPTAQQSIDEAGFLSGPIDPNEGFGGDTSDRSESEAASSRDAPGNVGGGFGGVGGDGGGGGGSGGGAGGDGPGPGGGSGEGRHKGGLVTEDEVPGVTAGDVRDQTLQEGEFVIRREAVQALGPALLNKLNKAGTRRLSDLPGVPPRKPGGRR